MKYIYIVMALRWGDWEGHSYIVGTALDLDIAKQMAENEHEWRGGKYDGVVYKSNIQDVAPILGRTGEYSEVYRVSALEY